MRIILISFLFHPHLCFLMSIWEQSWVCTTLNKLYDFMSHLLVYFCVLVITNFFLCFISHVLGSHFMSYNLVAISKSMIKLF